MVTVTCLLRAERCYVPVVGGAQACLLGVCIWVHGTLEGSEVEERWMYLCLLLCRATWVYWVLHSSRVAHGHGFGAAAMIDLSMWRMYPFECCWIWP